MKISIIAAILLLSPFATASADDSRQDGHPSDTPTVTPVMVDAHGQAWRMEQIRVLVPVRTATDSRTETADSREEPVPYPIAAMRRGSRSYDPTALERFRLANLETLSGDEPADRTPTTVKSSSDRRPAESARHIASHDVRRVRMETQPRRPVYRDSSRFHRSLY